MRVQKTLENASFCLCMKCPSYSTVCRIKNEPENSIQTEADLQTRTHFEKMFCAFQKSNCIHLNRGCICDQCVVHQIYALQRHEYCLHSGGEVR